MIPVGDVVPSRTRPVATPVLVGLNALLYVVPVALAATLLHDLVRAWGLQPGRPAPLAILLSMVLHGGWLHLAVNLFVLGLFGGTVEDRTGRGRFLLLYAACGAVAAIVHVLVASPGLVPSVGADGAIAGVLGAYFLLFPRSRVLILVPIGVSWRVVEVRATVFLGLWLFWQLFVALGGLPAGVAAPPGPAALAAAFVAGMAGIAVLRRPERQCVEWWDPVYSRPPGIGAPRRDVRSVP